MKLLTRDELEKAGKYLNFAVTLATKSNCLSSRCGSVIVKNDDIIGQGYNSPPLDEKISACWKDSLPADFKSDRTCCVHAEQRAILDALTRKQGEINGSILYFARVNEQGENAPVKNIYCTICSKMGLDVGISEWILQQENKIIAYDAREYNKLSFNFNVYEFRKV